MQRAWASMGELTLSHCGSQLRSLPAISLFLFLFALCGFDVKWPTPIVAVCTHLLTIELLLLMFWARASSRAAYCY